MRNHPILIHTTHHQKVALPSHEVRSALPKWDQNFQKLFCHNSRVISLTARSAVLSLSGSRLLCGPGVALGDAGSAAGKGPRAGQGCQLRKVAESKRWVDFTTFSQEILFVFLDM